MNWAIATARDFTKQGAIGSGVSGARAEYRIDFGSLKANQLHQFRLQIVVPKRLGAEAITTWISIADQGPQPFQTWLQRRQLRPSKLRVDDFELALGINQTRAMVYRFLCYFQLFPSYPGTGLFTRR